MPMSIIDQIWPYQPTLMVAPRDLGLAVGPGSLLLPSLAVGFLRIMAVELCHGVCVCVYMYTYIYIYM